MIDIMNRSIALKIVMCGQTLPDSPFGANYTIREQNGYEDPKWIARKDHVFARRLSTLVC